jgi:hypothetical protein
MGWVVNATFRPLFTPGKTRYPLYRRQGGPQGRSGQVGNISPPPGVDLRNVQPVASRYVDWATRPTDLHGTRIKLYVKYPNTELWNNRYDQHNLYSTHVQ